MKRISLLYPSISGRCPASFSVEDLIRSLELELLLGSQEIARSAYLACDLETIRYRQQTVRDLMTVPGLSDLCIACAEQLESVSELARLRPDKHADNEANLYTIKEIEMFLDLADTWYHGLRDIEGQLSSEGMRALYCMLSETCESETYLALKEGIKSISFSARSIKSVTLGVNLDAKLNPYEAGIVAIHERYFHSGDLVSRFLRMERKQDEMLTLAPLSCTGFSDSGNQHQLMNQSLVRALNHIVSGGFRSWKEMLHRYFMLDTAPYLHLLPELKFLNRAVKSLKELKRMGLPLCYPTACAAEQRRFEAKGLYHPGVAKKMKGDNPGACIVGNDLTFDENGMLYVLTGPNRGGKSVLLSAIGAAQLLFQLGLPAPAEELSISPVDGIHTHFPVSSGDTVGKGRFGEECERLQKLLSSVTANSMVLLDESLSGTNSYEASAIAEEVLTALSILGCRGVFSTHLFELAKSASKVNEHPDSVSRVDNLVMGIDGGERTYRVSRKSPDGKSYARDIADKYGLSVEMILKQRE